LPRRYRSRVGILLSILETIHREEYATITEIVVKANIPHDRLKIILDRLLREEYVELIEERDRKYYTLTPSGYKLMRELQKIKRLMDELGLSL